MSINIAPKSIDTELSELMRDINSGYAQLPDFQRNWTWDDNRIKGILASLSQGYPMGAIMNLEYGNSEVVFKCRSFEGAPDTHYEPRYLVLDGQQRLTSMYRATCSKDPVTTKTDKGKVIKRYYYLDMNACLNGDDLDLIIVSVPEDRKVKENFDRDIKKDLSTHELEYEQEMFPLNIIFDSNAREDWADGYKDYHSDDPQTYREKYKRFRSEVLDTIINYKLPVITLSRETPREAVCKVFENVNTGGVALTVFELVTATYATYNYNLREDWEECRDIIRAKNKDIATDVMDGVDETAFLTTVTLYTTYLAGTMTTCKKKDVLQLPFDAYIKNKDAVLQGYEMARDFLMKQSVFRSRDLPYTTQIIPLAAICAVIGKAKYNLPGTQKILAQWFWCGIMGEMYGGANESRYANDIDDLVPLINGKESDNRTIKAAFFSATRLLSLKTRNSAAYKGIMALLYHETCLDFMQGTFMTEVKAIEESPDIHHIFPEAYCIKCGFSKEKWDSIINKTPLLPASNRQIGGHAPSEYSQKIMKDAGINEEELKKRVESHLVNYDYFIQDNFELYFIDRAKALLSIIERAMGKEVADRKSEQVIQLYGSSLE